jgi:putative transposase
VNHKAYKYRIYPKVAQAEFLDRNFGATRWLWNQFVAKFNSWTPGSDKIIYSDKQLKDQTENAWLNDVISYALQQKCNDFMEYQKQFFNKKRKVKVGRPSFKKRGVAKDSFRIPAASLSKGSIDLLNNGQLKLPKMDTIKVSIDRPIEGRPLSVTVSKTKTGHYYISVLVEFEPQLKPTTGQSIGIDLGIKTLATMSNGIVIDNPKWFRKTQAKLAKAQRHLSRKQKGSKRRERQRIKVAKIYETVSNQRNHIQHVLSHWLVSNYDHIIMEDLNVKGMMKNRKLSKAIADASFSSLVSKIGYKSKWYGRTFHKVDRWFASSKTCSCCGHKLETLDLGTREWDCPSCGVHHDRDLNAAQNILHRGLTDLYGFTSDELADYKHRESLRPMVEIPMADSLKCLASFIEIYKTA